METDIRYFVAVTYEDEKSYPEMFFDLEEALKRYNEVSRHVTMFGGKCSLKQQVTHTMRSHSSSGFPSDQ